ncbi:hypothetical protein EMPS_10644 [Entomortierella parvispora]|uniref:Uncharacterized protein n=1 Tax=Entomortierella parvispora TaxID=205924 RepID=A0A9P3HK95_9FUNG|nr:hypothetical protein EMPS_10644 [Entomortierella parvispora]
MAHQPNRDQGPGAGTRAGTWTGQGRGRGMHSMNAHGTSQSLAQGQRRDFTTGERSSSIQSSHGNPPEAFTNISQAFDAGYSIPTAMFNTAAFGDVDLATAAATTRESTGQTLQQPAGTKQTPNLNNLNNPLDAYSNSSDSLDDDLILPPDFDDDFELELRTEEVAPPVAPPKPAVTVQQNVVVDSQVLNENQLLKQRIAEMEARLRESEQKIRTKEELLRNKEDLLSIKSGEAAIHKANLHSALLERDSLQEKNRKSEEKRKQEREELENKYRKELENAGLHHQFELHNMLMSTSKATPLKPQKVVKQQSGQPTQPPMEFSRIFAPSQSQSAVRAPAKMGDGFPVSFFSAPSASQRKVAVHQNASVAPVEKPRPTFPPTTSSSGRSVKPTTFNFPTMPSEEEKIRTTLLGESRSGFGMRRLMELKSDEGNEAPLPGSVTFERDMYLDKLRLACIQALNSLTVKVNTESAHMALNTTTGLLRESIYRNKPLHVVNTFKVLKILFTSCMDISEAICKESVSFLEPNCGDPLNVASTIRKGEGLELPSTLACIYYLFITRTALERSNNQPERNTKAAGSYGRENHEVAKGLHHNPGAWDIPEEADKQLEADLFGVLDMVARDQIKANNVSQLVTLIHWGVLGNILTRYQNFRLGCGTNSTDEHRLGDKDLASCKAGERKDWFGVLDKTLQVMDVITQDQRCCRSLCGWSVTQGSWKQDFSFEQVKALAGLLEIQPAHFKHMTDGVLSKLQIKAVEILTRVIGVELEQTKKLVHDTKVVRSVTTSMSYLLKLAQRLAGLETRAKLQVDSCGSYRPALIGLAESSSGHFGPKFLDNPGSPGKRRGQGQGGATQRPADFSTLLGLEMEFIDRLARSLPDWIGKELRERDFGVYNELAHVICNIAENCKQLGLPANAAALAHDMLRTIIPSEDEENEMRKMCAI